jgi:FkbM family methyltransferase
MHPSLSPLSLIARRFQFAEQAVPARWRLPLRYAIQRTTGGLEPEMAVLDQLLAPGGVALDVGANHGIYTYALARLAGSVHSFEPLAACSAYIQAASLANVTVHNCALSDRAGRMRLYVPRAGARTIHTRASLEKPAGECEVLDVDVRTIDSFALPRVDFIKIDVEGAEAATLRGAAETLDRHRPALLVEIDRTRHTRDSFDGLLGWLAARGYVPHVLAGGRLRRSDDAWADAAAHFNFLFPAPSRARPGA